MVTKQGYVYLIHALGTNYYKIGLAGKPEKRLIQLQTGSVQELRLIKRISMWNMHRVESALHHKYASYRIRDKSEWFELSDYLRHQVITTMEELISYQGYSCQVVLQKRGFDLDNEGEIIVGGVRLKDTMPSSAYELFLKGLEAELTLALIHPISLGVIARPATVSN
jgi:hypothetical protein